MLDEFSIQAAREQMEDMGMDEESIEVALEEMIDAASDEVPEGMY